MPENQITKVIIEDEYRREDLPVARRAIAAIREQPGLEGIALSMAGNWREAATDFGEHEHVFGFLQEESLIFQHAAMEERDKPEKERNDEERTKAIEGMEAASVRAEIYRQQHNLADLEVDSLRTLARVDAMKGDYEGEFEKCVRALGMVEELTDPQKRLRRFEIAGFLAEGTIGKGLTEEGVALMEEVWGKYENEPELQELKKSDYFTWAVWKAGVRVMEVRILLEKGKQEPYMEKLGVWLGEAEELLVVPTGEATWGDYKFNIRRKEIAALRRDSIVRLEGQLNFLESSYAQLDTASSEELARMRERKIALEQGLQNLKGE